MSKRKGDSLFAVPFVVLDRKGQPVDKGAVKIWYDDEGRRHMLDLGNNYYIDYKLQKKV